MNPGTINMRPIEYIMGVPVLTNKHMPVCAPKQELSTKVNVSDAFRSEFNTWLKDYFGETPVIYKVDTSILYSKLRDDILGGFGAKSEAIVTHPMNMHRIQEALEKVNAITKRDP